MKSLFITVLNMSITGSFVILAIMLARLLIKKLLKNTAMSSGLYLPSGLSVLSHSGRFSVYSI